MASPRNLNPFGPFLATLGAVPSRERSGAVAVQPEAAVPAAAQGTPCTQHILIALRQSESIDPSALLSTGLDFLELGRAIERLKSLEAIQMVDSPNGRQLIRRGPKYLEVCSLFQP